MLRAPILVLMLFLSYVPSVRPQQSVSTVEGSVVRADTGNGISGARVTLTRTDSVSAGATITTRGGTVIRTTTNTSIATLTDEAGRFHLMNVDAGSYRLHVAAEGYARTEFGQRTFPGEGEALNIGPEKPATNLKIALLVTGAVSGRVLDTRGKAAVGVPVQLMQAVFSANGERAMRIEGSARTDDKGEYRLFWVTPGRYFLSAGTAPGVNRPLEMGTNVGSPNELLQGQVFAQTFYPGVDALDRATRIDVSSDQEYVAANLTVARQTARRIRGRVLDTRTGRPPATVTMGLSYSSLTGVTGNASNGQSYDPITGQFELRDVAPGSYALQVLINDSTQIPRPSARIILRVSDADIEGLTVNPTVGLSVRGRFSADSPLGEAFLQSLRILLSSPDQFPFMPGGSPIVQATAGDGTFQIDGVGSGKYRLFLPTMPNYYVKAARYGRIDALDDLFEIDGNNILEIVYSTKTGAITGVVDGWGPLRDGTVVLIPARRERKDLFRATKVQVSGQYSFQNLSPGDYKLLAFEAIAPYGWFEPSLLDEYDQQAQIVRVSESRTETTKVLLIPATAVAR